jgi:hypothetical protein
MSNLIITEKELAELTTYKRPSFQARILREWGIPHVIGRDGRPRVLREHLKIIATSPAARRHAEPNLRGLARR